MRLVKGKDLTPEQRREVLAAFVHRKLDTTCKTDEEWIAVHAFYVTKAGKLARNVKHCEPAWMADPPKRYTAAEQLQDRTNFDPTFTED